MGSLQQGTSSVKRGSVSPEKREETEHKYNL